MRSHLSERGGKIVKLKLCSERINETFMNEPYCFDIQIFQAIRLPTLDFRSAKRDREQFMDYLFFQMLTIYSWNGFKKIHHVPPTNPLILTTAIYRSKVCEILTQVF